ncbi:hypothetical protein SpiGrapes_0102 [Sphaerochaeta pleomorpha str. Grapes]|uniref:Uncharacterized protein n=1 Tax=Sphaerochaeta pleomorpha (strain ATCC BAA-1885 / DSM 22778 / Grapes) TaxID=158190 RepID=G8QT61_SPHPG|nr:hypothetical protein [Sphaerochaeta pleomorpha]AEV27966.1 hypothetical protein SpiGrapes_0102 [Sphaerochaeta pleomorpha str. Grapes]
MNTQNISYAIGVSIENDRYVLCKMNLQGKDIHYYSGRTDTERGQQKFLSRFSFDSIALIPDCYLAVRAYELFSEQVAIFPSSILWDTWKKAGVKNGEPLSRFAAEFLLNEQLPPMELSDYQKEQILLDQQKELEQIQRIGDSSQAILQEVIKGSNDPDLCKKAMQNEYASRTFPAAGESTEETAGQLKIRDDGSFFSRFYKVLKDSY